MCWSIRSGAQTAVKLKHKQQYKQISRICSTNSPLRHPSHKYEDKQLKDRVGKRWDGNQSRRMDDRRPCRCSLLVLVSAVLQGQETTDRTQWSFRCRWRHLYCVSLSWFLCRTWECSLPPRSASWPASSRRLYPPRWCTKPDGESPNECSSGEFSKRLLLKCRLDGNTRNIKNNNDV